MDDRIESNKQLWEALTGAHIPSDFYDVEGFKAGRNCLHPIELSEVGEVAGKSILHLQCHFGMDTLSWARLGAQVMGVDFSEDAVDYARRLSRETSIPAEFICSDIYALSDVLDRRFDIVYTSYGVLAWLPDLVRWAGIIAHYLKPGGFFYIVEIHPVIQIFYNEDQWGDQGGLKVRSSYFPEGTEQYDGGTDYASSFTHDLTSYEWQHTVGEVVSALAGAGLRIEFLHEFPGCCYRALPELAKGQDGMWHLEGDPVPLTFSLKATKPQA